MPGLPAAWAMAAGAFAGFSLLLPVVPRAVADAGGSGTLAGAVTAVFMGATVLTQPAVPRLVRARGYRPVLAAGCLLLGLPSLLLLLSLHPAVVLPTSAVRGIGFGMITVASAALVAELAPARLLGRATGAQGIAIAAAQMVGLPLGLAVAERASTAPVFVLGAAVPTLALVAIARLPQVVTRQTGAAGTRTPLRALALPAVAIAAGAVAYGGLTSLLSIAVPAASGQVALALALISASTLVGRYGAGAVADRIGAGRLLPAGLGLAAVAMVPFALAADDRRGAAVLLGAAVAFGLGFGVVQNDALMLAFRRAGPAHVGAASAAWNIGFDAGTGAGSLLLGGIATVAGYPAAFATAALLVPILPLLARIAGPSERPAAAP
ncbi:MFS transporter [Rhodococcus aetherivorans]